MFKFRTAFSRSVIRSTVSALLLSVLVPVVTVMVIPQAMPAAASGAATCDTITRFDSATALNCWQIPRLSNGNVVVDANDQQAADQDLLGDSAAGDAAYEYFSQGSGAFFFFRMRVEGDPGTFGNSQSWNLGIGSDTTTIAWVGIEGNGNSGAKVFRINTPSSGTKTYYTAIANGSSGAATSTIWANGDGSNRFWIYFKLPVDDLPVAARTGQIGVAGGTATGGGGFNKDCIDAIVSNCGNSAVVNYGALQTTNLSVSSTAAPDVYLNKSGGETGTALSQTVLKNVQVETVTVTNNGGSADSFTISATLPAGMTFETTTGRIYGAPTETKTSTTYTITANSANGTDTATYTLTVNEPAPNVEIRSGTNTSRGSSWSQSKVINTAIDTVTVHTLTGGGQVDSYTITPSSLPNGVSFNTSTGILSGTPTETWTATSYTLTAYGPGGNDTVSLSLTVTAGAVAPVLSFTSNASDSLSETQTAGTAITGYTFDTGGITVDSYTVSRQSGTGYNIGSNGLTFSTSTGVISGTPLDTQSATTYLITAYNAGGTDTATFTLTVVAQQFAITLTQPTGGTISLSPSGGTYDSGTVVTATVALSGGYTDGTWSGACSGTTATSCLITVNGAKAVGASLTAFAPSGGGTPAPTSYELTVTATGQGIVSPASGAQAAGSTVSLAAAPRTGWRFSTWTGDCSGSTETCSVAMTTNRAVGAIFVEDVAAGGASIAAAKFQISVSVTGLGIVQVAPGQPAGGYDKDSLVKLTAAPRTGWALEAWGGACSGVNEFCILTMDAAKTVTAKFKATAVPEVVSAAWVQPQGDGTSIVSWEAASGAVQYIVEVNGRTGCTSAQTSCSVGRLLGPRDIVAVAASNAAGRADMSPSATFIAPTRALQLFTVNFNSGSAVLTARAKTALTAAVRRIQALGYTEMTLYGHTDNRESGASALSLARARAVATFVGRSVDVTFTTIGRAATTPLTTNSTIQGRAANRRVVGWVK